MNKFTLNPLALLQYSVLVPVGKSAMECMNTPVAKNFESGIVAALGLHGEIYALNLTATLVIEGILRAWSTEEILAYLLRYFNVSRYSSEKISRDLDELILFLRQKNCIAPIVENFGVLPRVT